MSMQDLTPLTLLSSWTVINKGNKGVRSCNNTSGDF